ncbi:MAG: SCO family protein [Sediminibacterium sp.]|nr:SCO family protein [Sediminibacterium sp.]
MLKYFSFYVFCLIVLAACNNATNNNTEQIKDSLVTLPFFNQPDWTPEWIGETDSAYKNIHAIPSFSFLDQNGKVVNENLVNGKIYVANFFFTKCRNICPKMTNNMHLLQESFKDDTSILLLSHSVTPETDDVKVLNKYAIENKVDAAKWHLLTGDKKAIYSLAKQQYFAGDTVGYYQSGNEFLHTENFILVDQYRRIRGVYNGTLPVEINRIIEDIAILKSEIISF